MESLAHTVGQGPAASHVLTGLEVYTASAESPRLTRMFETGGPETAVGIVSGRGKRGQDRWPDACVHSRSDRPLCGCVSDRWLGVSGVGGCASDTKEEEGGGVEG